MLFQKNQIQLRAESRVGVGILRPQSFAIADSDRHLRCPATCDDGYVTVAQCARRMSISEARVIELAKRGVLRSYQNGVLWVQPALVSGAGVT